MSTLDSTADPEAGFTKAPFHPSADPDIFCGTEALAAVRAQLIAALEGGAPALAVLTGPAGVGKTTLLRRLARELEGAGWRTLVEGLPLGLDDMRERLPGAEPGRRVLVGLDEAQALPRDLLAALDSLLALRPDLAILLVGHSSLEAKLDASTLGGGARQEVVRCRLAPLDAPGVGQYIEHRWRAARSAVHPFAPEAVERIAAVSGGVPQMINLVCSLALRRADRRGLDRVTAELVDEVTAELPRPELRHRIGLAARPSPAASVRSTRAAVVAATLIPPLLVGGVLLLRHATRGPGHLDSRVTATASHPPRESVRAAALPERPDSRSAPVTAPHPSSDPVRVVALVPEPASIDFTTDAAFERPSPAAPTAASAPAPPIPASPRALEPPRLGTGETKGGREATSPKVSASTPTPAPPKTAPAPAPPPPKAVAATPSPASPKLAAAPPTSSAKATAVTSPPSAKATAAPSPSSAKATAAPAPSSAKATASTPSLSSGKATAAPSAPSAKATAAASPPSSAKAAAASPPLANAATATSSAPSARATASTAPPSAKATAVTAPSPSAKATAVPSPPSAKVAATASVLPSSKVVATETSASLPPRTVLASPVAGVAAREPGKDEALLRRAEYGELSAVQALLVEGASPEARDHNGFTPLMLAAIHGDAAIVQALLAVGARVNVQSRTGLTPAMLAAINNRAAVLRVLLDRGADVNARTRAGWTALTYAAWRGHAEIVRVLLARGADPNVTDREGWTILQYASWRATDPIASDDLPGAPADGVTRPASSGPAHAEVVALLKQARVRR